MVTKPEIDAWTGIAERVIAGQYAFTTESEFTSVVYGLRRVPGQKPRLALARLAANKKIPGADKIVKRLVLGSH